jgi:hypothetical protein
MIVLKSRIKNELKKWFKHGYQKACQDKQDEIDEIHRDYREEIILIEQENKAELELLMLEITRLKNEIKAFKKERRNIKNNEQIVKEVVRMFTAEFNKARDNISNMSCLFNWCNDEIERISNKKKEKQA